ncbi:MAG: hypothetical protein PHU25_17190 [Deltaproteobacteria bacterium]|nr:hypothetical protein [Deltaproteobacteria bacterium]
MEPEKKVVEQPASEGGAEMDFTSDGGEKKPASDEMDFTSDGAVQPAPKKEEPKGDTMDFTQ